MKLLQVPTANLEERIKEELEENPHWSKVKIPMKMAMS
jgi:DNA-directed RNA polymerase specialized sigma54-like protein